MSAHKGPLRAPARYLDSVIRGEAQKSVIFLFLNLPGDLDAQLDWEPLF